MRRMSSLRRRAPSASSTRWAGWTWSELNSLRKGWSGRLDSNQRPPHPQCDALPGCATPRLAGASRQACQPRQARAGVQMQRRRRRTKAGKWVGRVISALLVIPALYLIAALIGSLIPVNRHWTEPEGGTTVYIADNGIHADIVMPVEAQGLDWSPFFPDSDLAAGNPADRWIAFGSGEERV